MKSSKKVQSFIFFLVVLHQVPCIFADHVRGAKSMPSEQNDGSSPTGDRSLKKKKKSKAKAKGSPKKTSDTERMGYLDISEVHIGEEEDVIEDIELQFMADEDRVVSFESLDKDDDPDTDYVSWVGTNEDGETFTYVKSTSPETGESIVSGSMTTKDGVGYTFYGPDGGDGVAEVYETFGFEDEMEIVAEDREAEMDGEFGPIDTFWEGRRLAKDDTSYLDVLVVYTPEVARALGSKLQSHIDQTMAWSNQAMQNSQISSRFRLAGGKAYAVSDYTGYSESGRAWTSMLTDLRSTSDGRLDFVHSLRNQVKADFVAMLVAKSGACGIGFVNDNPRASDASNAFSVTRYTCSTSGLSFVHELGHNMGLNHDRSAKGHTSLSRYPTPNYGYQDPNRRFRTVLAYQCSGGCTRQPIFSGPGNEWSGRVAGDNHHDNTNYIEKYLHVYADWRISDTTPATPAPTPAPTPMPTPPTDNVSPPTSEEGNDPVVTIDCSNKRKTKFKYDVGGGNVKESTCKKLKKKINNGKWTKVDDCCNSIDIRVKNQLPDGTQPFVWQTCQKECSLSSEFADRLYDVNSDDCPEPLPR